MTRTVPGSRTPDRWAALVLLALEGDPAAHAVRRRLLETILRYPGLHLRELARECALAPQHAQYHLRVLERVGLVARLENEGRVRYYTTRTTPVGDLPVLGAAEREVLVLLRAPAVLRLVVHLLLDGPTPLGDLARRAGLSPATGLHHLRRLQVAGVVERLDPDRRWRAVEPDRLRSLLLAHEPPPRLIEGFLDVWQRLGP